LECTTVTDLTCDMHGDILVVDWKKHKPKGVVWAFNEDARERITGELALEMIQELKCFNFRIESLFGADGTTKVK
jgi:hypothetical protein